jgi:3-oxoacyl-[acyl-carrier protein] reductase
LVLKFKNMMLKNKTAIVTGSAKGIGREIALALAEEGFNVVVSDIDQEGCGKVAEEIKNKGVNSLAVECDVSQKDEVDNLIAKTVEEFKGLDVLVNNAGIYPFVPFMEMKEGDWDKVLNINLKSVFLCCQAAAKKMKEGGKIVNISSIASFVGFEGLVHYCASKGGMNSMTRALALEFASKKINVNAVAPGAINTPGASQGSNEETRKQTIALIPLARMGQPKDISGLVVFLVSDKAEYITGQTIIIDGGWTLR